MLVSVTDSVVTLPEDGLKVDCPACVLVLSEWLVVDSWIMGHVPGSCDVKVLARVLSYGLVSVTQFAVL